MKHYVLTRSAYGPAWTIEANRRRLEVTRAVTASLMAAQTNRDWAWVVLLDERDPLLEERKAVFAAGASTFVPILWTPPEHPQGASWDRHASETNKVQRIAAEAYRAPWRSVLPPDEPLMMTRLDDDDGLSVDAIARYRRAAVKARGRTILMLPSGVRVWRGQYADVTHRNNAMHTLIAPAGDHGTVYDYGHATCRVGAQATVIDVDHAWGWIWVRHEDTISGWKKADTPITRAVRAAFPVDWAALRTAWRM